MLQIVVLKLLTLGLQWTPLSKTEAPTEVAAENPCCNHNNIGMASDGANRIKGRRHLKIGLKKTNKTNIDLKWRRHSLIKLGEFQDQIIGYIKD